MSKTYHTKHDFDKEYGIYEFPHGLDKYNTHIEPGEESYMDPSGTTCNINQNPDISQRLTRHPNKKKKTHSLGREFSQNSLSGTRYWRNRFCEEHDKSSRMHLVKRELTQIRRRRMKEEVRDIINEELNN